MSHISLIFPISLIFSISAMTAMFSWFLRHFLIKASSLPTRPQLAPGDEELPRPWNDAVHRAEVSGAESQESLKFWENLTERRGNQGKSRTMILQMEDCPHLKVCRRVLYPAHNRGMMEVSARFYNPKWGNINGIGPAELLEKSMENGIGRSQIQVEPCCQASKPCAIAGG